MIQLKYRIEGNNLIVSPYDDEEREALRELRDEDPDKFGTDGQMHDVFESMIANSELCWINPADTGDLTDAPMLGILGEEGTKDHTVFLENYGLVETGRDGHWMMARPILKRWAFMDYQVRSPLDDLLDKGEAVFISGEDDSEE